jgi:hypothetical protein
MSKTNTLAGDSGTAPALVDILIPHGTGPAVPVLERVDCGSDLRFGVCRQCGRGHGLVVFRRDANNGSTGPEARQ